MNIEGRGTGTAMKKSGDGASPSFLSSSTSLIKRVFHTRTEFLVYPGGKIYPGKSQNWFEDKIYQHKPKVKKKAEVKESQLTSEESY